MQVNAISSDTPPATLEEIFEYLSQFSPRTCDFCGNNTWTVMLNAHGQPSIVDHNQYVIIPEKAGGPYVYAGFAHRDTEKCLLVRCQHCGQVKQFSYGRLLEWVVEHRKTKGPES
jgi:hypothetical protein